MCSEEWSCSINVLSEPIDVFTEWMDACMEENEHIANEVDFDAEEDIGY